MSKELISDKQGISVMTMFIMGSSLVLGTGWAAERDIWLAILLAAAMALPVMFVYSRILSLYPGRDMFDISVIVFGKIISKFIMIPFFWFPFFLGSLVIRDFSEFISITGLAGTPEVIPKMFMAVICILVIKDGIEVLGRVLTFILPMVFAAIIVVTLLSLPMFELSNIRPVLYKGFKPVLAGAFGTFSFPFTETVVFTMIFCSLKKKGSPYKVYFNGLLLGGLAVLIISVRNVLVLGDEFPSMLYFPTYSAASVIKYGNYIERIEVAVTVVFLFNGFSKISVCMYAATKGFAKILNLGEYRNMAAPVGLSMAMLSGILFDNAAEGMLWTTNILPYYYLPFTIILPVIIWITAEIKTRFFSYKQIK